MRLELIDGIRLLIIAFLAYVPTVTISGWFTAWVAKKCDDDLPERFGFLTLDPFVHFSLFGFSLLLIGQIFGSYLTFFRGFPGFGRYIFLEPSPTAKRINVVVEFFARPFAHFIMLTFAYMVVFFLLKTITAAAVLSSPTTPICSAVKDISLFFLSQNMILCNIYFLFGVADMICFTWSIPRFFSMHYFVVLIVTLLLLSDPVDWLLGMYIKSLQGLLVLV